MQLRILTIQHVPVTDHGYGPLPHTSRNITIVGNLKGEGTYLLFLTLK